MQKSASLKVCGQVGCVQDPEMETSVPPLQKNTILQTRHILELIKIIIYYMTFLQLYILLDIFFPK
jgi:hypothetical protein